jgi:hypothetical protein
MHGYNLQRIAPRVINGQSFEIKLLEGILPAGLNSSDACQASRLNGVAIVRLRLFEIAVAQAQRQLVSERMRSFRQAVRSALSCSPTQSFLWSENGSSERALRYLRMSYLSGPNEGWISAKRNGFSLAIYDQLPEDIAAQIVPEFVSLVRSGFYAQAASNLSGPGWSRREVLIAALAPVREVRRHEFSNICVPREFLSISRVSILSRAGPGIEVSWQTTLSVRAGKYPS